LRLHEVNDELLAAIESQPVSNVRWVPIEKVEANDYNPNKVAPNELRLLHTSVMADGFTQPVVTVHERERDVYVIVDGFHRWLLLKRYDDVRELTGGLCPVVIIEAPLAGRMASTIRHNRARGKHSIAGMSQVVFGMLDQGLTDERICAELGLEADELLRLKHITGFARLFADAEYGKAWQTRRMIQLKQAYDSEHESSGSA